MLSRFEKRLVLYSSLFICLVLNSPKIMALRETSIASRFIEFHPGEFAFQLAFNLLFCFTIFYVHLRREFKLRSIAHTALLVLLNLVLLAVFTVAGALLQETLFTTGMAVDLNRQAYTGRMVLSQILVIIVILIIREQRKRRQQEDENNTLKHLYMEAQIQLLQHQLNPHFFFNALSSLSALVKENPDLAQHYISHLSRIFRYVLRPADNKVTLKEELVAAGSYAALIKMRFETGFEIRMEIDAKYDHYRILHMSIQPLLENAIKHNCISAMHPLVITLAVENAHLVVKNTLMPLTNSDIGTTRTGLTNLSERYLLLMNRPIEIARTNEEFIVYLPIEPPEEK